MTDTELLDLLRRDRAAGTEALLTRYRPLLRYVIGGILAESGDGEDCLSEVCLVLWQKLDSFDPAKGSLSAWLTAVARNTALNHLKAHRRRGHGGAGFPGHAGAGAAAAGAGGAAESGPGRSQRPGPAAVLPPLLLFAAPLPDRRGDGYDGTGRGRPPLPAAPAAAAGAGR